LRLTLVAQGCCGRSVPIDARSPRGCRLGEGCGGPALRAIAAIHTRRTQDGGVLRLGAIQLLPARGRRRVARTRWVGRSRCSVALVYAGTPDFGTPLRRIIVAINGLVDRCCTTNRPIDVCPRSKRVRVCGAVRLLGFGLVALAVEPPASSTICHSDCSNPMLVTSASRRPQDSRAKPNRLHRRDEMWIASTARSVGIRTC
jgi:hypothetical protein